MAAIRHKVGSNPPGDAMWYPKPWYLRRLTGDTSGGTTLAQLDRVLDYHYNINLEVVYKDTWSNFRHQLRLGRAAVLQGSYIALYDTKWSGSRTFKGNHAIYVNEVRRNYKLDRWEYLVYDPLCDHRRSGIDQAPSWIPERVLREFAGKLLISSSYGRIGMGYVYAAYTRDTEPATELAPGATAYPYGPRAFYARVDGVKVRRHTWTGTQNGKYSEVLHTLDKGDPFLVYQYKRGERVNGSVRWYGNRNGTQWVNATALVKTRP